DQAERRLADSRLSIVEAHTHSVRWWICAGADNDCCRMTEARALQIAVRDGRVVHENGTCADGFGCPGLRRSGLAQQQGDGRQGEEKARYQEPGPSLARLGSSVQRVGCHVSGSFLFG